MAIKKQYLKSKPVCKVTFSVPAEEAKKVAVVGTFNEWNEKKAVKLKTPPERCYNPIPDGKSGNMQLPKGCVYCRHKFECHKDANEGKGLRVFKYSNGNRYLTQVPKVPNVIEVTQI